MEQQVRLPEGTRQRLMALQQAKAQLEERLSEIVLVSLDAMGVEGQVKNVELASGTVTLDVPDPVAE